MRVTLTNPLPRALAHYEAELRDCIARMEPTVVGEPGWQSVEGLTGARRAGRGLSLALRRLRPLNSDLHLVLWPAMGYLDALTWVVPARTQPVVLIMHDIDPLHPHFGYSQNAHRTFRAAVRAGGMHVACHTDQAATRLAELTGVTATVVTHPMLAPDGASREPAPHPRRRQIIRVLGQYKSARDTDILAVMAAEDQTGEFEFEVWGRGWPPVPGWDVNRGFVDEATFAELVATASALVIPYREYSQSGVMVRAAESCVPVVGLPHPQLRFLYGDQWPGTVAGDGWLAAAQRAIRSEPHVAANAQSAHSQVRARWTTYMEEVRYR
jgi:hypothetical protein